MGGAVTLWGVRTDGDCLLSLGASSCSSTVQSEEGTKPDERELAREQEPGEYSAQVASRRGKPRQLGAVPEFFDFGTCLLDSNESIKRQGKHRPRRAPERNERLGAGADVASEEKEEKVVLKQEAMQCSAQRGRLGKRRRRHRGASDDEKDEEDEDEEDEEDKEEEQEVEDERGHRRRTTSAQLVITQLDQGSFDAAGESESVVLGVAGGGAASRYHVYLLF
jgi:hypothetical protein